MVRGPSSSAPSFLLLRLERPPLHHLHLFSSDKGSPAIIYIDTISSFLCTRHHHHHIFFLVVCSVSARLQLLLLLRVATTASSFCSFLCCCCYVLSHLLRVNQWAKCWEQLHLLPCCAVCCCTSLPRLNQKLTLLPCSTTSLLCGCRVQTLAYCEATSSRVQLPFPCFCYSQLVLLQMRAVNAAMEDFCCHGSSFSSLQQLQVAFRR